MNRAIPNRRCAFTLVELLVVIAIIAVLVALIFPATGMVLGKAQSAKCSSNLRQIASAMGSYCTDNDDLLPGPLSISQFPILGTAGTDRGSLLRKLQRYFQVTDLKVSGNTTEAYNEATNPFICPSYAKVVKNKDGPSFIMNPDKLTQFDQTPWGDPDASTEPLKRAVLTSWTETMSDGNETPVVLAKIWAMKDADQLALNGSTAQAQPMGFGAMARKPVHVDHRNAIFYDWHVAELKLDDAEYYVNSTKKQ